MIDVRRAPCATRIWLALLAVASTINIALWLRLAWSERPTIGDARTQLVLSGIFTFACAFRSLFPRVDLERQCAWDTWLSSIALGRTVATVAEVCFGFQCQLFVLSLSRDTGLNLLAVVAWPIAPLAMVSQVFCWHAMLTLKHVGHAIEELLWTLLVLLVAVAFGAARPHVGPELSLLLTVGIVLCLGAAGITALVDIPMYIGRWTAGVAGGVAYLSIAEGLREAIFRRRATLSWEAWRPEVPWMTLYFTGGVWASLMMAWVSAW